MLRKKKFLVPTLIAAALLLQVALSFRYTGKDCCGLVGNTVETWAPTSMVLLRYGLPDERHVSRESNQRIYTYNHAELFGKRASMEFYFSRGRVYWIRATIWEDTEEVYRTACETIRAACEDLRGFRVRETDDGCEIGSDLGPPFKNADLSLLDDRLVIDIIEQR